MSAHVEPEVIKWFKGVQTELKAGSVLFPQSEADRAWNDANARACRIIDLYKRGDGIFQI